MNMIFYEIEHGIGTNHFLFERNTDHSFPLHMHGCYEMVLMLEGSMNVQLDRTVHTLHEGDLILIKPNRLHSYETPAGERGVCLLCVFSGDLIAAITDSLIRYRLPSAVLSAIPALYRDVFLYLQEKRDVASIKGALYLLCGLFHRELDTATEDTLGGDYVLLYEMFRFIEQNVGTPCALRDMAEALKYNESYLSRLFVKCVGIPYSDYVRNVKINHACYLLRNTDESVYTISVRCGYTTQSSFTRSFKQITGVAPREYKLRYGSTLS
jgi:AraC-like DNA-binding protein